MLYLSKGTARDRRDMRNKQSFGVSHCGVTYMLAGIGARLWQSGRRRACETVDEREIKHLRELAKLGVVEISEESGELALYRLLAGCVICPAETKPIHSLLAPMENRIWQWINGAGLRLTIGELVKLAADGVRPSPELLGNDNVLELTDVLYNGALELDTTLDILMEASPMRDEIVINILTLLRKRRIVLI